MTLLTLTAVNANVYGVHAPDGLHVGNLKRINGLWKFKAIGHDADGAVIPGGGPLTDWHNTVLACLDATALAAFAPDGGSSGDTRT